ncbi:MAG: hypothetical protein ACTSO9_03510 [Candidatus Helarchaeota archaeon]
MWFKKTINIFSSEIKELKDIKHEIKELEKQYISELLRSRFDTNLPDRKIYPKVHMNEDSFKEHKELICQNCKKDVSPNSKFCIHCSSLL